MTLDLRRFVYFQLAMTLESVQVRSFGASGAAPTSIRSLRSWTKEDGDATCASASTRRPRSSFITRFRNRTENLTPGLSAPTLQSNLSVGPGIRSELEGAFCKLYAGNADLFETESNFVDTD